MSILRAFIVSNLVSLDGYSMKELCAEFTKSQPFPINYNSFSKAMRRWEPNTKLFRFEKTQNTLYFYVQKDVNPINVFEVYLEYALDTDHQLAKYLDDQPTLTKLKFFLDLISEFHEQ